MQRNDFAGSVTFRQNWAEYRDGFGSAAGNDNYWLGLDKVYRLVKKGSVRLRVEVLKSKIGSKIKKTAVYISHSQYVTTHQLCGQEVTMYSFYRVLPLHCSCKEKNIQLGFC